MSIKTIERSPVGSVTSKILRDFLRAGGRVLVTPDGALTEGGGPPRPFTHGSPSEAAECLRAGRAYFAARGAPKTDARIIRAVRLLGQRTENGWMALEAMASINQKRGLN